METAARLFVLASLSAVLTACARGERVREIDWAKSALARNPAYEILATDEQSGVFTVRDTATGTVLTLRLEDLVAAPRAMKAATPLAPLAAPAGEPVESVEPVENPEPASEPDEVHMARQTTVPAASSSPSGGSLAEGPGYRITRGSDEPLTAGGSVEGPGYSITRHEPEDRARPRSAEPVAANVERRTDPIVCQGDRLMRIDGETIEFTGDAVIAERGCDLYISNARIRAGGVGIIARQARVHIVNSTIGGIRGSYEASQGAEIYVARSTFSGVGRRFDSATMNDLGGNAYTLVE